VVHGYAIPCQPSVPVFLWNNACSCENRPMSVPPHLSVDEREQLSRQGWLELYVSSSRDLVEIAQSLGIPHPTRLGGSVIDRLVPTERQQAQPGTMSYHLGFEKFPFHTDGAHLRIPPRFILLKLADGAHSARPTLLCTLSSLSLRTEETETLARDVWIVRGNRRPFLSPILLDSTIHGCTFLRFDRFCMKPASARSERSAQILEFALAKANPVKVTWASNRALILDNWRMLHARGEGPLDRNEGRILERVSVLSGG
jgi:L-asparagine oxygenase